MFINFSNHPSEEWSRQQLDAARKYGRIKDISFPIVKADAGSDEIIEMAGEYVTKIIKESERIDVVMVQGEYTLAFAVASRLKKAGYKVVAACAERQVKEKKNSAGDQIKEVKFSFVQFREYI